MVVRLDGSEPVLLDQLSDVHEIAQLEASVLSGELEPLETIYERRVRLSHEEDEFGNYVEDLLSQPFLRPEIMDHGVQWLKSKIRIEQFQHTEHEATRVIAQYAFQIFKEDPQKTDFYLAGPAAKVRIRVLMVQGVKEAAA